MVRGSTPKIIMGIGCQVLPHILGISPTQGFMCQFDFDTYKGFLWKKWPKNSPHFEN